MTRSRRRENQSTSDSDYSEEAIRCSQMTSDERTLPAKYKPGTRAWQPLCPVGFYEFKLRLFFPGAWTQEQTSVGPDVCELKHLIDGVGDAVERTTAQALAAQPIVFNEVND